MPQNTSGTRGESGAVMILALVFLIVVGGVVMVLANSVSSHLEDTGAFSKGRSTQYDATSAVDSAIQNIRYAPLISAGETLDASPPVQCWNPGKGAFDSLGPDAEWAGFDLWCSTVWNPSSADTRTVTISACPDGSLARAACAVTPFLQAVVVFDDYPPGVSAPTTGICSVYCGSGETIESWSWSPTTPTVTDLSTYDGSSSGPITGGITTITLLGTGFVTTPGATTVNFVQESGGAPSLVGATLPVTPTSVTPTQIQVIAPAVTSGTTYFVTVKTPNGTTATCRPNQPDSCFVFTYTTSGVNPTIDTINVGHQSLTQGTTNGGDLITITGKNFYNGAQVNFLPENGGSMVSASDVIVDPQGGKITAVTPSIVMGTLHQITQSNGNKIWVTDYLVEVVTSGGSSVTSSADEYQYDLPDPIVSGIGGSSTQTSTSYVATSGSQIALVGSSFYSGSTVTFQANNGGSCPNNAKDVTVSSPTVNSASLITTTVPSLVTTCTYNVVVNTQAATSSNTIGFQL